MLSGECKRFLQTLWQTLWPQITTDLTSPLLVHSLATRSMSDWSIASVQLQSSSKSLNSCHCPYPSLEGITTSLSLPKLEEYPKAVDPHVNVFLLGSWNKRPRLDMFHCISTSWHSGPLTHQRINALSHVLGLTVSFRKQSNNDRTRQNDKLLDLRT